ncbi:class I SAM-dependent methyltransferase [Oceanicoccus sagamiensis]|uniref:Methyltransferase domain-containing protein n=1 Tax=Oceanicoccus sagamiensis TaxID=716816 RepID=A0A1X9NJX8_9GAMM|nr:class I SAM-dependent methyltransferase [Oceanicoccus sagamiensis]ARN76135.1 hypothetical protein BST96_19755 [Oceanicoccus sagamiensis]
MNKLNKSQWTSYWQESAAINSFGPDNYNEEIASFWQHQLSGKNYSKLLDLACGNGAISWLANDIINTENPTTEITGVDFSNITPFSSLKRKPEDYPLLNFIGNTDIEALPFEDNSYDAAISQYGIEYSNLDKTIAELSRVLKHKSSLYLLIHTHQSDIVKQSTKSLQQYETILKQLKIHEDFQSLHTIIGAETNMQKVRNNPAFSLQSKVIESKLMPINQIIKSNNNPPALIAYKQQLISRFSDQAISQGPAGRKESIEAARRTFSDYIKRINDLKKIALSDQAINKLIESLNGQGFSIENQQPLSQGKIENIGLAIIAHRNQPA